MHDGAEIAEQTDRGVLCAKCEHINPRKLSSCERCSAHLYVTCVDCGHRNERGFTRCKECGRRLHRRLGERLVRRIVGPNFAIKPLHVLIFCAGIALVFGVIVFVANIHLPDF